MADELVEDFFAGRIKLESKNIIVDKDNFKTFLKHSGLQLNVRPEKYYAKKLILSAHCGKKYTGKNWKIV